VEVSFLSETTTRYNAKIQPWTTDLLIADWKSLAEVSIRQYTTPQVLLYAKTIIVASDHAGTKVKNSCKSCRLKWIQTSLILILLCFSWMIMTSKQRKMQIKLVWNHFVLKFILTYNIPVYIHNWEQANLLSSSSFHLYFRNSQHFHSM